MEQMSEPAPTRPGASAGFWIVAAVSLLWNGFGAYDYLMSVTRNAAYLANFPPEMLTVLDAMPAWSVALWATGIWGSVAGSLLLLARSRHAATAFAVSLVGAALSFVFQLSQPVPAVMDGPGYYLMPVAIVAVVVLQWWYARRQTARGVLR